MVLHNVYIVRGGGIEPSEAPPGVERAGESASCVKIATPSSVASLVSTQQAVAFYERKTQDILKRYGPGPRVHYHTGLVDQPPSIGASSEELHRELVAAQERTLEYAAEVWDAASSLSGDVLDVGCGLGGGTIFWTQKFGANVTAVTNAPSHI